MEEMGQEAGWGCLFGKGRRGRSNFWFEFGSTTGIEDPKSTWSGDYRIWFLLGKGMQNGNLQTTVIGYFR